MEKRTLGSIIGLGAVSVLIIAGGTYLWHTHKKDVGILNQKIAALDERLVLTQDELLKAKNTVTASIDDLAVKSVTLAETLTAEQQKNASVEQKVGQVGQAVSMLEKLSKSDPELLKKYSKVYFLNEHYVPIALTTIDPAYTTNRKTTMQLHSAVWPYMQQLIAAARADSSNKLELASAYRSFGTQAQLKSAYRFTYGAGTANTFSAEQGYSEHQLGTAVDFTTSAIGGDLWGFEKTNEYNWLMQNAYKYGFVLSYPANNAYYTFEPWHWRFVGVALATELHNSRINFYEMDQRQIDSYLAGMFD